MIYNLFLMKYMKTMMMQMMKTKMRMILMRMRMLNSFSSLLSISSLGSKSCFINNFYFLFSVFQRVKIRMDFCSFCNVDTRDQLKSCVCQKVSYCSKECQAKDWKTHKPSCPPYIIRESPGKGRGLFTTRKIKEGQIILEEYPLLILRNGISLNEFQANLYPGIDKETKAKILKLNDPMERLKTLDTETIKMMVRKDPIVKLWMEARTDEMSKIFRIISGNLFQICEQEELYDTMESGLYNNHTLINHGCVPNATTSWVMGDFKRRQVRAMMTIEKNQEILINYMEDWDFVFGSRQFRQQELLVTEGFQCLCSQCSLEGEDLGDNERIREEIRENLEEKNPLMSFDQVPRKDMKKFLKVNQQQIKLVQKLGVRAVFVDAMIYFYHAATRAKRMNISILANDPDTFKEAALKYAKMFGDNYIHAYNKVFNN